ncbi:MAG: hypothetical protein K2X32_02925 [Phycisphaerales bacterium]|nr:hypothetical protein [Phycisphaerales bacterium]
MDNIDRRVLLGAAGLVGVAAIASVARGGPLTPPVGPITSTGKTLDQIEPRTDVRTLAGNASAMHVISQPGSYFLSANLNVPSGMSGILINSSNVTLDLNGFAVRGVDGSLHAIRASSDPGPDQIRNIAVLNGLIENFDNNGIDAADSSVGQRYEGLSIRECGTGMYIWQAIVSRCRMVDCGTAMIAYESNITECGINNCGGGYSLVNSRLSESSANNCGTGLDLDGSLATGIEIWNGFNGAFIRANSTLRNCSFSEVFNFGVEVWRDFSQSGKTNIIEGNTFIRCGVAAISCDGPEAQRNLITSNRSIQSGATPAAAFAISTANRFGPIVNANAAATGDLSTIPAAAHPLANIVY